MRSNLATNNKKQHTRHKRVALPTPHEALELIREGKAIPLGVSVNGSQQYHYYINRKFAISITYEECTDRVTLVRKYQPPFPDLTNSHLFIGRH